MDGDPAAATAGEGNDVEVVEPAVHPPTWSEYMDEILRGEVVALIFLRMIGLLGQTCFEVSWNKKMIRKRPFLKLCFVSIDYRDADHEDLFQLRGR